MLAHGFARERCESCKDEFLVAFSCKGRGVCPSCSAKRAHVTAVHLVERVLPHVPYRQWTLSFPHRVRWVLPLTRPGNRGIGAISSASRGNLLGFKRLHPITETNARDPTR